MLIVLDHEPTEKEVDYLYEAGCDNGVIGVRDGNHYIDVDGRVEDLVKLFGKIEELKFKVVELKI